MKTVIVRRPYGHLQPGDVVELDNGSASQLIALGVVMEEGDQEPPEDDDPEGDDPEGDDPEGDDPEGDDPEGATEQGLAIVVTSDGVEHVGVLPTSAAVPPAVDTEAERQAEAATEQGDEPFDPADHTVDEVTAYLSDLDPEGPEYQRVLAAEREGKGRKSILGDA